MQPAKASPLSTILELLQKSQLAPQGAERAAAIFTKLGEAEARVHDVPLEKIHFHEWVPLTPSWTLLAPASAFNRWVSKSSPAPL